jgi:hypothetical protein
MPQTLTVPDERQATGGSRLTGLCRVDPGRFTKVTSDWPNWYGPSFTAVSHAPDIDFSSIKFWGGTTAQAIGVHRYADNILVQPSNVLVFISSGLAIQPRPSIDSLLTELRQSVGLNVTETADLLGVARRTLYTWTGKGSISPQREGRVSAAVDALRPLAIRWSPARVRHWLDYGDPSPRTLLKRGAYNDVRRAAEAASETGGIPLLEASRIVRPEDETTLVEMDSLGPEDQKAYLTALTRLREPKAVGSWTPPELAYSDPEPDE